LPWAPAARGWEVIEVYADNSISGSKGGEHATLIDVTPEK
jgi:hypothetical protein